MNPDQIKVMNYYTDAMIGRTLMNAKERGFCYVIPAEVLGKPEVTFCALSGDTMPITFDSESEMIQFKTMVADTIDKEKCYIVALQNTKGIELIKVDKARAIAMSLMDISQAETKTVKAHKWLHHLQ